MRNSRLWEAGYRSIGKLTALGSLKDSPNDMRIEAVIHCEEALMYHIGGRTCLEGGH